MTTHPKDEPAGRGMALAYALWLIVAAALVALGLAFVFLAGGSLFDRGFGALLVVLAGALGFLAGKARSGDVRGQRAAVVFSIAFALFQIAAVIIGGPAILLLSAILLMVAGGIAFRARTGAWFSGVG